MSTPVHALRVLVVDDSPAIREMLAATLRHHGVGQVLEAGDGAQVFRMLERVRHQLDLIFCDLQMPGIDGVETLRGIATRHTEARVVLISALDPKLLRTVSYMAAKMGLHVVATLAKPFTEAQVLD